MGGGGQHGHQCQTPPPCTKVLGPWGGEVLRVDRVSRTFKCPMSCFYARGSTKCNRDGVVLVVMVLFCVCVWANYFTWGGGIFFSGAKTTDFFVFAVWSMQQNTTIHQIALPLIHALFQQTGQSGCKGILLSPKVTLPKEGAAKKFTPPCCETIGIFTNLVRGRWAATACLLEQCLL